MRYRELNEGRVETVDALHWGGQAIKLKVTWDPRAQQLDRLFSSSNENFVRGLVSGDQVVVWDGYHTEHEMAARALGLFRGAGRENCFFIHRYSASDNRIGPHSAAERLSRIPALARLHATGNYRFGGPDHALAKVLTESIGLHGWWITHAGEYIDVDHDNDQHHADVAKASFDIADEDDVERYDDDDQGDVDHEPDYDSAEEAIKTALDFGWVRGSAYGRSITIEWERLSTAARKAVLSWLSSYGQAYENITIGKAGAVYKNFETSKLAIAYVRADNLSEQMILRAPASSDVDKVEREVAIHKNPFRHDLAALLMNSREKTLRGFIDDTTGDYYVWDAYLTDHGGAHHLMQGQGFAPPFPRIVIELENGRPQPFGYIDHGMSEEDWGRVPKDKLERSIGKFEWKWS